MDALLDLSGRVNDLLNAASLLGWDSRTMMPASGALTLGQQIATLTVAARDLLCSNEMAQALDAATAPDGTPEAAMIAAVRAAVDYHSRIPAELVRRRNHLAMTAHAAWAKACRQRDVAPFLPALSETVEVCRAWADAAGYHDHPYDALLDLYEPGNTVANLSPLLERLRRHIAPLARDVHAAAQPGRAFLRAAYPEAAQLRVAADLAQSIGYDMSGGRLDLALHPFEVSFTRTDVRLTTWVDRHWLPRALFTTLHEAGHGIYEQNVDPAYTRTPFATDLILLYAVGGVSFGMHESQSRLWENHVGRSRAFWARRFGALRDVFPDQLDGVTEDAFWRAINASTPVARRTEADELTYDLHTIFRTEIERDLIAGTLSVGEVRDRWNADGEAALGFAPRDDAEGMLQDVHRPVRHVLQLHDRQRRRYSVVRGGVRRNSGRRCARRRRGRAAGGVAQRRRLPTRATLRARRAAGAVDRPSARSRALSGPSRSPVRRGLRTSLTGGGAGWARPSSRERSSS